MPLVLVALAGLTGCDPSASDAEGARAAIAQAVAREDRPAIRDGIARLEETLGDEPEDLLELARVLVRVQFYRKAAHCC
jgi:hypothetical protein